MDLKNAHRHAMHESPTRLGHRGGAGPQTIGPQLMRISEVDRACDPASPLKCVSDWIREFLACPHAQLGRPGSVCPFVPIALRLDTIWMAEMPNAEPCFEQVSAIVSEYRNLFLKTEPTSGPEAINKVFVVVFPFIANNDEGANIIDKVQARLKKYFVETGLMVGEFHPLNESPGLRNPDFRPLRSPVPMLAIRHMVESDLPFLIRKSYAPQDRSSFLRSYIFRMGGKLSQVRFNEALAGLIAAEIAIALNAA